MSRRILGLLVVACVILTCSASGLAKGNPNEGAGGHGGWRHQFQDMGDATWAEQYVNKWAFRECIRGRSQFEFAPNAPVKQAEALAMILRALGYEDEALAEAAAIAAGEASLPFANAKSFPEWTVGYIAVALEEGLIPAEGNFQAEKSASRAWVALVLVNALGLDEEDLAPYQDADLGFADKAAVDPELVAAIAYAIDEGLIVGYPDHTFQPNKPVTRAEMAVLLDRLGGHLEPAEDVIRGKLLSVTPASGDEPASLLIRKADKTRVTVTVAAAADVYIDGDEAELADLEAGMWVEVTLDDDGAAAIIEAGTSYEVSGVVDAIAGGNDPTITIVVQEGGDADPGDKVTYPIADDVVVRMRGHEVELAVVMVGDRVEMLVSGGEVTRIVVEEVAEAEVTGYFVRAIAATGDEPAAIVIRATEGATAGRETSYDSRDLDELAVRVRGEQVGYEALRAGDLVELKLQRNLVVAVVVVEDEAYEVSGTVVHVDTSAPCSISITDEDVELRFDVSPDVTVRMGRDRDLSLEDVKVGDEVELTIEGGTGGEDDEDTGDAVAGLVTAIVIEERAESEVEGTITALDVVERTLAIVDDDGREWSFAIAGGATVEYDDEELALSDLAVGDEVELTIEGGEVTGIAVEERAGEEGKGGKKGEED
jgi:hypothetical protein